MPTRSLELPATVEDKLHHLGRDGARWRAALPALVAALEREWGIAVGAVLDGGSEALVVAARHNGSGAILKLGIPGETGFDNEVAALELANGRGYVRVLRHDLKRRAMLQERLGARLSDLGLPVAAQIEIICTTLRSTWVKVPKNTPLMAGATKARWLREFIESVWQRLGQPCSEGVVAQVREFTQERERAYDADRAVLVHGDAHPGNTLQTLDATAFKFVDPDGLNAEPACDLAVPMRGWPDELLDGDTRALGARRCAYIGELTGVEREPIWQWGFVECVSTGLYMLELGWRSEARAMLEVAEAWTA
jgi:streptomycin 6-kinase